MLVDGGPGGSGERPWPFVGREQELARARSALEERRGVVLFGEPGVGKSAFARMLVDGGAARWHRVTASLGVGDVAFGAWSHLLPSGAGDLAGAAGWRAVGEHLREDGSIRLLVDDAHWLDPGSTSLLHHLVSTHQAVAVVTCRSGEPAAQPITALWKDGHLERIDLDPFTRGQLDAVLEEALGAPVEPGTVARLAKRTGGNPLLVRELVEDARRTGRLRLVHGAWIEDEASRPSPRLVDLLADRVADLAPDERSAAEVLAVAAPVAAELLARAISPAAVQALAARGLLQSERAGLATVVRPADPLMAEVLVERMAPGRHDEVLGLLVDAYGRAEELDDRDALQLAGWRLDLALATDPDDALFAADLARASSDFVAAERFATAAIEAGAGLPGSVRLGEALMQQQRHAAAEAILRPVAEHLEELGEDDLRFRYANARARSAIAEMDRLDQAIEVLESTIPLMANDRSRWALEAHLSFLLADCGRFAAARAPAEALLANVDRDERSALTAFVACALIRTLTGRCDDSLALSEAMVPVALRHLDDRPEGLGWIGAAQMLATYVRGDLHEAEALGATMAGLVADQPDPTLRAAVLMYQGLVLADRGRLGGSLRKLRQAAALHEVDNRRGYQAWCFGMMARAHAQRGELAAAGEALAAARRHRWTGGQVFDADVAAAGVWIAVLAGDRTGALRQLDDAVSRVHAEGASTLEIRLRHEAVRAGVPVAAQLGPLLAAAEGEQSRWVSAQVAHVTALARDDGAGLVEAGRAFAELGIHLQAAEAFALAAGAHARLGAHASAAQAKQLGAQQRQQCEGASTPALRFGELVVGLTDREVDVTTRAAAGASNQEIADALGISVRTAETHLQRAFAKLGIHRRGDLVAVIDPELASLS